MSNLKIFVEWERPTVFAGEDIKCIITFKNVAPASSRARSTSPRAIVRPLETGPDQWDSAVSAQSVSSQRARVSAYRNQRSLRPHAPGHRSTMSLSVPVTTAHLDKAGTQNTEASIPRTTTHKHKRSISIISIGANTGSDDDKRLGGRTLPIAWKTRSHIRAASFQDVTHKKDILGQRSSTSPLVFQNAFPSSKKAQSDERYSPALLSPVSKSSPLGLQLSFIDKEPEPRDSTYSQPVSMVPDGGLKSRSGQALTLQGEKDSTAKGAAGQPSSHETSPTSIVGTPRNSMDFYSQSNHSTETQASEYPGTSVGRHEHITNYKHPLSHLTPSSWNQKPETLMMGYVQLLGSFSLDSSLVNLVPFESIKKKGVIGGQGGGGVVGVKSSKRDSGLFALGSIAWSNIGQSIGDFLGAQELSSINEMKGIANSRSIPIISTPQSILFVDLNLSPGESKSYSYRHTLPQGIPPSHKGRAIKASYHLAVGTQRPRSGAQQHPVQHIETPFKVLPAINGNGQMHTHDLFKPYIILKDKARSQSLVSNIAPKDVRMKAHALAIACGTESGFLSYATDLLGRTREGLGLGFMSPSSPYDSKLTEKWHSNDFISSAAYYRDSSNPLKHGVSSFQIQRGGNRVAAVLLARSTFSLGEPVSTVVDFHDADIPCYGLHVSLETSEIVDTAIAVRSGPSIHRATRRVYGQSSESTMCSRRSTFTFMIPMTATPGFVTSGVSLEWSLRLEFVTGHDIKDYIESGCLLEKVLEDDRGKILCGAQELPCESFDIKIPLKVYGAIEKLIDKTQIATYSV